MDSERMLARATETQQDSSTLGRAKGEPKRERSRRGAGRR